MRTRIIAAFLFLSAPLAMAQDVVAPPLAPAPAAAAPIQERATWCDGYATWLVAMTPPARAPAPADVELARHLQVELNACKIDPQQYERETRAEADAASEVASG